MFQVDRITANKIELGAWSPTMDLIAIAFDNLEVSVVRTCLSWQVVWSIKEEEGVVKSLVWRSDGKILAVSYTKVVNLYNVEGGTLIHSSLTTDKVLHWSSVSVNRDFNPMQPIIPYLPSLDDVKTDITTTRNLLETAGDLNVMMLCDAQCTMVKLVAQGILHVDSIQQSGVEAVGMSPDGSRLCLVSQAPQHQYKVYSIERIVKHKTNINDVGLIYSKILTLSEYLLSTFKAMSDTWEDVLCEFNKKLFSFHMSLHPTKLSEQFLHLLVTGNASIDMENFLVHTLKEKEIEKLLNSTMHSYKGIEKLITQNFMSCCEVMCTHLTTLLGMSRWYDRYGDIGLTEARVQTSLNKLSGLMIKGQELLQCISLSKMKLGAFLKWLLKSTILLCDGTDNIKLTEDELDHVVKFLRTGSLFSTKADKSHFNIDLVWQYFADEDLMIPPQYYNNKILDTVLTLLKDKKPYLTVQPNASLVQSHKLLEASLMSCFDLHVQSDDHVTCLHSVDITGLYAMSGDILRFVDENNIISMIAPDDETGIKTTNQSRHIISDNILHIFGYDKDFILVTGDAERQVINVCFEDDVVKSDLPRGVVEIYISESRRLGAVVSAQRHRIQILDLEEDGED